ncbi:MAG: glycosyltransferase family 2 protein [Candidatus Pacearchaeota archaeon]
MNELVSVVIITYERPQFITKCVKSVLKQSYKNIEIIIVNDGSKQKYPKFKNKKIRYFKNRENRGPAYSRNFGIKKARGKIIFILDDDIILTKNYITILIKTLKRHKKDNVVGVAGRLLYPQKPNKGIVKNKPLFEISKLTGDITFRASLDTKKPVFVPTIHSCSVFWRDVFEKIKFDENRYKGNYTFVEPDLCFRAIKDGYKLMFEPRAIAYHYQIKEGGCRRISKFMYNYYTVRNALFFMLKFYKLKTIYMFPLFIFKRLFKK